MKFCEQLNKERILKKAFQIVGSARTEIIATMLVNEELKSPLPKTYHFLLQKKLTQGVQITRYGYGTRTAFNQIQKKYPDIRMVYNGTNERYQRMLLVDNRHGMFAMNGLFFYTKYMPLVQALRSYAVNSIIAGSKE